MKNSLKTLGLSLLLFSTSAFAQNNYVSEVWISAQGDGTYENAALYAAYSDPDACMIADDCYVTS